ncbi:MAG: uracil-DNA glycosylase family protein [Alphaproteobacteria bacterium]|nr:uracil-DNA glycosylase family protein [Alphaproteobacteria bacterium]MCB9974684.1 uracil-DNA glycosylase family protein [Rhodospirillales bacterium]
MNSYEKLFSEVKSCTLCAEHLPLGPRPVFRAHPDAKILVVGQAPGIRVHRSGLPFDDPSGDRLRKWMGIDKDIFYDRAKIAFLPMGFCYPGTGKSGDLPPRPECAKKWRTPLLATMQKLELTLVIGQYAQAYHLPEEKKKNLTDTVKSWKKYWPEILPLPHPSPRNTLWLKRNSWLESEIIPELQTAVKRILNLS